MTCIVVALVSSSCILLVYTCDSAMRTRFRPSEFFSTKIGLVSKDMASSKTGALGEFPSLGYIVFPPHGVLSSRTRAPHAAEEVQVSERTSYLAVYNVLKFL